MLPRLRIFSPTLHIPQLGRSTNSVSVHQVFARAARASSVSPTPPSLYRETPNLNSSFLLALAVALSHYGQLSYRLITV